MSTWQHRIRHATFALLTACGGSAVTASDPAKGDAAAQDPPTVVSCEDIQRERPLPYSSSAGDACATEGECCAKPIPDGTDAEWYRCGSHKWSLDTGCVISTCPNRVDGTVQRADGHPLHLYCLWSTSPGTENAPPGFIVSIAMRDGDHNGGTLELRFAERPTAGTTYDLVRDAGPADAGADAGADGGAERPTAALGVRLDGGFAGGTNLAYAISGTVTISSVTAEGKITELHASVVAEMIPAFANTSSSWQGPLTASW